MRSRLLLDVERVGFQWYGPQCTISERRNIGSKMSRRSSDGMVISVGQHANEFAMIYGERDVGDASMLMRQWYD